MQEQAKKPTKPTVGVLIPGVKATTGDVNERPVEPNDHDKEMHISLIYHRQSLTVPASTPGGITEEAQKHHGLKADDSKAGNHEGGDLSGPHGNVVPMKGTGQRA
jgi:hypothetical protein